MTGAEGSIPDVIETNIEVIDYLEKQTLSSRSLQDRFADAITDFSGSMRFFYLHLVWFGLWIAVNFNWIPGVKPFDPFPFGLLTMVVSLEAIFLSTFVMISQNRESRTNQQRASLDLQIDMLAEYEITRMLRLIDKMAEKLDVRGEFDNELDQLCERVAPDVVFKEIERRHEQKTSFGV